MAALEGIEDALANFGALIELFEHPVEFKPAFLAGAEIVRDRAKQLAPVLTGNLRDHIFAAPGAADLPDAIVGVDLKQVPYALDQELGSGHNAAQPYIRPAAAASAEQVEQVVAAGMTSIVEGVIK